MGRTVLSTAAVARLFDVTETTVKRWADDGALKCQKTPGGHRKFLIRYVAEFATAHNLEPLGALTLPEGDAHASAIDTAILLRDFTVLTNAFVEKALFPGESDLFRYLSYLYQHHFHLWEICDLVLRPGMCEIGVRWQRGEIGVSHEHRASSEVLSALAKLQTQVYIRPATGRSAICACLDQESHEIGLRCIANIFECEGWTVRYLGARTPAGALVDAIGELPPTVVCLSVSAAGDRGTLRSDLKRVTAAAHAQAARVVVGGEGASDELAAAFVCDTVLQSAYSMAEYIQHFPHSDRSDDKRHVH
jgi:methanogenic corrinoid protein MtbC1